MDGTRDSHTERSKSERERQIPYDITYNWNLISSTNEPFHRKENQGLAEESGGCWGGGVGWLGSLGLIDTNYCPWNGLAMRSFCVALRTMSRYLQRSMTMGEKLCKHVCVTEFPCCSVGKKKVCLGK